MNIYINKMSRKNVKKDREGPKIILADSGSSIFKNLGNIMDKYNFIKLSSEFAVNFIMESEKVDLIIISRNITNITKISEKASRKRIPVCIIEKDIRLPIDGKKIDYLPIEFNFYSV